MFSLKGLISQLKRRVNIISSVINSSILIFGYFTFLSCMLSLTTLYIISSMMNLSTSIFGYFTFLTCMLSLNTLYL